MNFRPLFVIGLIFGLLIIPDTAQAGDASKGAALAEKFKCASCHDRAATKNYPEIPFIRGQHQRYLSKQLQAFRQNLANRSGGIKVSERYNHLMDLRASKLTNSDINNLASYFSSQVCRSSGRNSSKITRPKLAEACAFCHGEKGRSPFIAYPKIAGQNMAYLIKQLKIMRAAAKNPGQKNARFHRTMAAQVVALTNAEIVALGYYYSKQNCE